MHRRGFLARIGGVLGATVAAPALVTVATSPRRNVAALLRERDAAHAAWLEAVKLAPKAPFVGRATAEDIAYWSPTYKR